MACSDIDKKTYMCFFFFWFQTKKEPTMVLTFAYGINGKESQ